MRVDRRWRCRALCRSEVVGVPDRVGFVARHVLLRVTLFDGTTRMFEECSPPRLVAIGVVIVSKKLSYHLLPISLTAQVLEWQGLWPGSHGTQVEGDDGVSCAPMIVLSIVAAILGAVTIVAGIRSHNWALCVTVGALLAVNGGLLYWGFKK